MAETIIALAFIAPLAAASMWANGRFRRVSRIPMQWSFAGQVNWTAPRRIALAFTPAPAAFTLGGIVVAISLSGDPRPGQEGMGAPVMLVVSLVFLFVHALHLWLIERTVK